MPTSRLSPKGKLTIPKAFQKKIGLHPGYLVSYKIENGHLTVFPANSPDTAFHDAISPTLTEWDSPKDHEAFDDL
jgi:bifunctional DNA-binding transcriptional regulator/antitoxin component of YhaV-PrlF toxin-antitoxin module